MPGGFQAAPAAAIARAAGVKRLVLYHLTQAGLPMFTPEKFTRGMDAGGPLDWRLSRDGMTIDLPAGGPRSASVSSDQKQSVAPPQ
jgi:hypothetical protein